MDIVYIDKGTSLIVHHGGLNEVEDVLIHICGISEGQREPELLNIFSHLSTLKSVLNIGGTGSFDQVISKLLLDLTESVLSIYSV